jgi:hypothetical protein
MQHQFWSFAVFEVAEADGLGAEQRKALKRSSVRDLLF